MIIKDGLVLQSDGTARTQDVSIRDGKIIESDLAVDGGEVIDARNRLVVPGLINTHYHSNENFFKGCFDNLPLELWMLFSYPLLAAPRQSPREIYVRTMLGCIEMLKTGCTTAVDFVYEMPETTPETLGAVLQAYADSGMRVLLIVGYADKIYYETVPVSIDLLPSDLKAQLDAEPLPTAEENMTLVDSVRSDWHNKHSRIAVGLGPSGPQRCSDRQLELSAQYASRHDTRIHIHTLETRTQAYTGQLLYGKSIIEHLADIDFLSPRVNLNHAIWLTEHDMDLVAGRGASTTHNLLSNLKLGSGISPVREMLSRGIPISLGSDGKSSNDTLNMYEVVKAVALLHKTHDPDFDHWLDAAQVWRMGTIHGANSVGMQDQLGQITPGSRADLVLLDINTVPFTPMNNPLNQLVYCMPSSVVDTVIVEGEVVVRGGNLAKVNEGGLLEEGRELGREFVGRSTKAFELGRRLMPAVTEAYRRASAQDVGVRRHIGHHAN